MAYVDDDFQRRSSRIKMAWKFGLAALLLVILAAFLTRGYWFRWIGQSLVCAESGGSTDAILVENFDPSYLVFERAATLQRATPSARVLVPVQAYGSESAVANPISKGIAELMARFARLQDPEIIPVREREPYALNVGYQIRDLLKKEHLRSVTVVAPAFRSRRSSLVYHSVLDDAGIQMRCVPVFEGHTPENWTTTWHGIQVVGEQFAKLQFYRFYALPPD